MGDISDILEARDTHIEVLQHEIKELRAGYDRLEAENVRLREALELILEKTQAYKQDMWPHHHFYLNVARKALNPE